jgi:hypothetical protein
MTLKNSKIQNATPLEFRRCAKHAIKITNGGKKIIRKKSKLTQKYENEIKKIV